MFSHLYVINGMTPIKLSYHSNYPEKQFKCDTIYGIRHIKLVLPDEKGAM